MKRPWWDILRANFTNHVMPSGPLFGGIYFYVQTLQTMSNITVFGMPVRGKKITKFYPFFPLIGPKSEFSSPMDTSSQIRLKLA